VIPPSICADNTMTDSNTAISSEALRNLPQETHLEFFSSS